MTILINKLTDCPRFRAGDKTLLRELMHPRLHVIAARYSLAHATVEPGEASLPHTLKGSEVYYILSGHGLMSIDGEEAEVSPGDTVYVPPGAVQHIKNTADTPLSFLCIVDPAWRPEDERVIGE